MTTYRGRFAPSPSGPLHFGSMVAAIGSWVDARHHQGQWLVRMEDIDPPREMPGAADDILKTLEAYGLYWDQKVTYQSSSLERYQELLQRLLDEHLVYRCTCTRKQIKATGGVYGNSCRLAEHPEETAHSIRLKVEDPILGFQDCFQGNCEADLLTAGEDYILKRKDGLFAYMLAVVADDIEQQITHVIRGADLLDTTTQQLYLYRVLKAKVPIYGHLPIALNSQGLKLSKQNHATAVSRDNVVETLWQAISFLKQNPPDSLRLESKEQVLNWAVQHWQPEVFAGNRSFICTQ